MCNEVLKLEVKLFYKTQRELATVLNTVIDEYWNNNMTEEEMMSTLTSMYTNNPSKIIKENEFTKILKQQCGKRRLEVLHRVLQLNALLHKQTVEV